MVYCGFTNGDVCMRTDADGAIVCISCSLSKRIESVFGGKIRTTMRFDTYREALNHLKEHRMKGDVVPNYAFNNLKLRAKKEEENKANTKNRQLWA